MVALYGLKGIMLVAEDQADDIEILKLAFERAEVSATLRFVSNGEEVIQYLNGEERFANRGEYPMPRLLLLDLKMPLKNGFEVLEWLQLQPGLRRLPVIVFTSSELPQDINRAFDLGANSYLVKPFAFEKLKEIARALDAFWFKLNRGPDCGLAFESTDSTWEIGRNPLPSRSARICRPLALSTAAFDPAGAQDARRRGIPDL